MAKPTTRPEKALKMLTAAVNLDYRGILEPRIRVVHTDRSMGLVVAEVTTETHTRDKYKSWCIGTVLGWKRSKSSYLSSPAHGAHRLGRMSAVKVDFCKDKGEIKILLENKKANPPKNMETVFLLSELDAYPVEILEA